MDRKELSPEAEILRREIKQMIPETAPGSLETIPEGQAMMVQTDVNGNKVYASDLLASKVFGLSQAMRVGRKDWGYRVAHFPNTTKVVNERKMAFLIPLSPDFTLMPGGLLREGTYTYITYDPMISGRATAIFIVPP